MFDVVVEVMPKPEILDAQGAAIAHALTGLGVTGLAAVSQGKRFHLRLEGELDPAQRADIEHAAATVLCNPVIETHQVHWPTTSATGR